MRRLLLGLTLFVFLLGTVGGFAATKPKPKTSCATKARTKCVTTANRKMKGKKIAVKCTTTAKKKAATKCGPKAKKSVKKTVKAPAKK